MCNNKTQVECMERSLFGSGPQDLAKMRGIRAETQLYLFNFQSLRLLGVFRPVGKPARDIVPEAWKGKISCAFAPPFTCLLIPAPALYSVVLRFQPCVAADREIWSSGTR